MQKYKCNECGTICSLEKLDSTFVCPQCGKDYTSFNIYEENILNESIENIINSLVDTKEEIETIINKDENIKKVAIDNNSVLTRNDELCINCGKCKRVCQNKAKISYDLNKEEPFCTLCGKCINECPKKAIKLKTNYREIKDLIDRNEKIVVALLSSTAKATMNVDSEYRIVAGLKKLGFDYVFDSSIGDDFYIVESVNEFVERIKSRTNLPYISSNCEAWNYYSNKYYPQLQKHMSNIENPTLISAKLIKNYFCDRRGIDKNKVVVVSISTCSSLNLIKDSNLDYTITYDELNMLLKEESISLSGMPQIDYDVILNESSLSGNLLETSGGFIEGILKSLYKMATGKKTLKANLSEKLTYPTNGYKEEIVEIGNIKLNIAVVNGIENIDKIIENDNYKKYHLIEIMYCNGGCLSGSTLQKEDNSIITLKEKLIEISSNKVTNSFENKAIKSIYKDLKEEEKNIFKKSVDKANNNAKI